MYNVRVREGRDGGRTDIKIAGAEVKEHIAAYLEYRRNVGDADGGVTMTPQEYDRYKQKLKREGKFVPQRAREPARKMTEEEEMSYYERRYQERRKRERELARRRGVDERPGVGAVMANGIPMALQDLYQQLELADGDDTAPPVMPWDRALMASEQASSHTVQQRARGPHKGKEAPSARQGGQVHMRRAQPRDKQVSGGHNRGTAAGSYARRRQQECTHNEKKDKAKAKAERKPRAAESRQRGGCQQRAGRQNDKGDAPGDGGTSNAAPERSMSGTRSTRIRKTTSITPATRYRNSK